MTTKKKSGLHLVKGKIKEYEIVTIYTCDDNVFSFALNEWDMWEGNEWIEFKKIDKSVMEVFSTSNISHISFVNKGGQPVVSKPILQPVA